MEFEGFDFDNPCSILKTEEEQRIERLQTGYITIQQHSMLEHRLIKQEDQIKKKQRKMLQKIMQQNNQQTNKGYDQRRNYYYGNGNDYKYQNNYQLNQQQQDQMQSYFNSYNRQNINQENQEDNSSNINICNNNNHQEQQMNNYEGNDYYPEEEEWEEEDEEESQFLLEDEILLDLDFFNKKGEENIDKCIMEKVSIWNDVRPVIQVVAKKNRIEIIYDNGHRLLKDFRFLIKKLEKYKENQDAKFASQLLQEHQKNIEQEEDLFSKIVKYYDHEMNVLYEMVAKNYEKSKQIAYDIIDSRDEKQFFAFSIRKLNFDDGIQHISGPFGYSKPLIDIFGGDMETYVRFIMRKGVIEHFNRQAHFIIFLMKLRIIDKTDLTVVTLDNIKIPISVQLERHSLSKIQVMPDCYQEDYLKIYKIFIKDEILQQLSEMRRSKENFQNTIQGLEDFEYFMQSQIFYDKFYKKQRHSSDSAKMCRYRYLDRSQQYRYQGKSQRKNCEEYLRNFQGQYKRKKCSKTAIIYDLSSKDKDKQNNPNFSHGMDLDEDIIQYKQKRDSMQQNSEDIHYHVSVDSQTIKQEEIVDENQESHSNHSQESKEKQKNVEDKLILEKNKKNPEQDENLTIQQDIISQNPTLVKKQIRKKSKSTSSTTKDTKKQQLKHQLSEIQEEITPKDTHTSNSNSNNNNQ